MSKIAVILGAGWKPFNDAKLRGKWKELVPPRCPELLWPLPDGHTVLSRYVAQFKKLGVDYVVACVGRPGAPCREIDVQVSRFGEWPSQLFHSCSGNERS